MHCRLHFEKIWRHLLTKITLILNYVQASRAVLSPFQSPAHEVRKVGFVKSDRRGKQASPRSELQAFHSRLEKSIVKSKKFERCLLTKITRILKLNRLTAEKQAERNHSNLTAESGANLRCAGCERGGSVIEVRDRPRDVLRAQRCAAIRGQAFQPRGMKVE